MYRTAAKSNRRTAAFTLVEMLVSTTVASIVILAVMTTYVYLGRNLTRLASSQQLEKSGRFAMARFKQDAAAATTLTGATSSGVTLTGIPLPATETGTYAGGTMSVTYSYSSALSKLTRASWKVSSNGATTSATTTTDMMTGLTSFGLNYYNAAGTSTTTASFIKRVEFQFTASTGDAGSATKATFAAVSPRTAIRNKPFLQ